MVALQSERVKCCAAAFCFVMVPRGSAAKRYALLLFVSSREMRMYRFPRFTCLSLPSLDVGVELQWSSALCVCVCSELVVSTEYRYRSLHRVCALAPGVERAALGHDI